MRKYLYLLGILTFTLGFISCRDCYYVENDLHGIWQVTSIENKISGEIVNPHGVLYYSFQRSMVKLGFKYLDIPEGMVNYISHFDFLTPDSIGMGEFVFYSTKEDVKVPIDSLHKFGIFQDYTIFGVEYNKHILKLSSEKSLVVLRRY